MGNSARSLFFMIIVHDQGSVDYAWNPAEQRQNDAEKKARDSSCHEHCQGWKHNAEKIP